MSNLTVSDWITFLTSERDVAFSAVLNVGAVLIAFVGIVFATRTVGLWQTILYGVITLAFVLYAFNRVFKPFGEKGKVSEEILRKIVSGELNNGEDIRKAWLDNK